MCWSCIPLSALRRGCGERGAWAGKGPRAPQALLFWCHGIQHLPGSSGPLGPEFGQDCVHSVQDMPSVGPCHAPRGLSSREVQLRWLPPARMLRGSSGCPSRFQRGPHALLALLQICCCRPWTSTPLLGVPVPPTLLNLSTSLPSMALTPTPKEHLPKVRGAGWVPDARAFLD